ncbi:bifunctional 2-polyprenyl-6-hydroxyphenol methylase/3-demethylubiquinol 3-O-methyltransferase UbiG [Qipengyuania sediminis]|uniref:bifunctional 2-polyprenyl-6-hydroxyphenol methylase/3-demethylubiquinol 3-O-methyltransferase UbiG n=1 Tax=Qipengyuania sediminis TaxID=1532023 RepID=UPI0010595B46|nr:bifunctional 2-polyprenyl-6-hydroxyphenol methylase/3-demethylubiquinol 3-O-methyltransferase UbiG [Qipengyuania sediminis]
MNDATATIRPREAAHFGAQAAEWWDPKGSSAMLHRLNPVRLGFIRSAIDRHWSIDSGNRNPLAGKSALDVGCGAGLLTEPLARLGASVTGVDAAEDSIAVARDHAAAMGLSISYHAGELAAVPQGRFDLVTSMEVLEHVADKPAFLAALAARLETNGLLVLSTPNRTAASRALLVGAAEALGMVPRGTHDWHDFVTPDELTGLLGDAGLAVETMRGIAFSATRGLHLSDDMRLNIILAARRA